MPGFPEIVAARPSPIPDEFIHTATKPVPTEAFIAELNEGLRQQGRDRADHPFVIAVEQGKATLNQIGAWRHQINWPSYPINKLFGVMWSRCPDDDLSQGILENMEEETAGAHSNTAGHIELTAGFMDECGWTADRRA
jgi:pyrroloquinoline quinone (PQQ) biosynthesis protein C